MEKSKRKYLFPANWLTSSSEKYFILILTGLILVGAGFFYYKSGGLESPTKVEVLDEKENETLGEIVVEIAGEVINPGVYKLPGGSRVDDLLVAAGGFSADADRESVEKYLNRAAKLTDGQKIYISETGKQTLGASANNEGGVQTVSTSFSGQTEGKTNINTASLSELDKLPGIGPVYGQSIVDHRPYSTVEELLSKGALKKSVYDKIQSLVAVY